jgi:hypothetical protein
MKIETKAFTGFVLLGALIASSSVYLARSASDRLEVRSSMGIR